ncbi:hypothetical protein RFI_38724 [Reticulomyxa filosa]|uniref:Uncharacterized protein n=1 Tax=Reticulomyxa filosa TaxID=46433 RepID=X6LB46_RETFI|nr:hypothetical protein RFI_38724 [Reticulomyxa filosa]|eukprot:ETN98763.1 hypothetical protein RFI_38724 [Reticulomyxa filosa]
MRSCKWKASNEKHYYNVSLCGEVRDGQMRLRNINEGQFVIKRKKEYGVETIPVSERRNKGLLYLKKKEKSGLKSIPVSSTRKNGVYYLYLFTYADILLLVILLWLCGSIGFPFKEKILLLVFIGNISEDEAQVIVKYLFLVYYLKIIKWRIKKNVIIKEKNVKKKSSNKKKKKIIKRKKKNRKMEKRKKGKRKIEKLKKMKKEKRKKKIEKIKKLGKKIMKKK